jgi:hypothetical protein
VSLVATEWVDAGVVLAVVFGSTILGFLQEVIASHAIERLRSQVTLQSIVLRDGVERTLPSAQVVPGDVVRLAAGSLIPADAVLYSTGRQGATDTLDLKKIGIEPNKRGYIEVDGDYRTKVPHVFAVGDCSGGFGLAATAMEQGRLAALHAFERPVSSMPELLPTGVYAIPEIAMVGRTEEDLTEAGVPYVACGAPLGFESQVSYVAADDRSGARTMTEYLRLAGRTRIATIAGPLDTSGGRGRLEGGRGKPIVVRRWREHQIRTLGKTLIRRVCLRDRRAMPRFRLCALPAAIRGDDRIADPEQFGRGDQHLILI